MRGKPKFKVGDKVRFTWEDKEHEGEIIVVDAYGTFFEPHDVSYDIMVGQTFMLYKHVQEKYVSKLKTK